MTTKPRRYRGCEITEGRPTAAHLGELDAKRLQDVVGWVADCPCGWATWHYQQSTLREQITAHRFRAANAVGCPL